MACMLLVDTYMKHSGNRDFQIDLTPTVLMNRTVQIHKSSEAYRDGQLVQKQVARWSVYVSLAHGVPLILSSVLFSSLSDTFGRKPFLFIGAFGICIKQFLITLAMFSRWSVFLFSPIYFDRRIMWELGNPHSDLCVCYF